MAMQRTYLSKEGLEKLKKELEHLQDVKKPEISKRIEIARAHGDLKENSEYHAAKEALTNTMIRIRDLTVKLSTAEILEETDIDPNKVFIGATVIVQDVDDEDEEDKYTLVSTDEVDPFEGKISIDSPIAQGLLGHKVGDEVEIDVPAGKIKYKIIKISR